MTEEDTYQALKYRRYAVGPVRVGKYLIRDCTYYVNDAGLLHRAGDLPAAIFPTGKKIWYFNGLLHRDGDQPAVIEEDGTRCWCQRDRIHRDGGQPAIIYSDGTQEWYNQGKFIKKD